MKNINWQTVIDEHGSEVWKNALKLLAGEADTSECFQQTFRTLLKQAKTKYIIDYSDLLRKLTTLSAINILRRRTQQKMSKSKEADSTPGTHKNQGPPRQVQRIELAAILRNAIGKIPEKQALVFTLINFNGLNHRQIAKLLNIDKSTVPTLLQRAGEKIKNDIKENLKKYTTPVNQYPNIVDKAIEALKKEKTPSEPTEDAIHKTKAVITEELQESKTEPQQTPENLAKLSSYKNLTKIIFSAAVIIAALTAIVIISKMAAKTRTQTTLQTEPPKPPPAQKQPTETEQEYEKILRTEQQLIRTMVTQGDTEGLIDMLNDGLRQSKVESAYYLGRMGGFEALDALRAANENYAPKEPNNPFAQAIDQIEERMGIKDFIASLKPTDIIKIRQALFEPKGVLSGLLLEARTGKPIDDAAVTISRKKIYTQHTDANGFYCFDKIQQPGNYKIKILSDAYQGIYQQDKLPIVNLKNDMQTVKHFNLQPACVIQVLVLNENDEPIENVRLIPTTLVDQREIGNRLSPRRTDANGLLLLGGFEPSKIPYMITAIPPSKKEYAPDRLIVELTDPNATEFREIVLKKGRSVRGYAEYADGVPVSGLKIGAKPDWWNCPYGIEGTPIDPNGYFELEHITPGSYRIEIHIPRGGGMTSVPTVMQTKLPPEKEPLIVKLPQKSPGSLVSISGKVTIPGDKKPHFIEVSAYSEDSGHQRVHLEAGQSKFTINSLEPGLHRLTFSGANLERKVIEDVEAPTSGLRVKLRYLPNPKLRGTVLSAETKKPIQKFKVRAMKVRGLRGSRYSPSDRWVEYEDPNGRFEVELVGSGIYRLQADAAGFAPAWSDDINTDANEPITIKLNKGGSIKGLVLDEKGKPLSGAKVTPVSKPAVISCRTRNVFIPQTGAVQTKNGQFVLRHLPPGKGTIKVTHPDYTYKIVEDIEVPENQVTEGIRITLTKGGTVQGYACDSEGRGQPNVTLFIQNKSIGDEQAGRLAATVTDSNGFYRVKNLPEKICYIRRSDSPTHLGVVKTTFLPTPGKTTRIDLGGPPEITGRLVIDGEPLANTRMQLGDLERPHLGTFSCFALTDQNGRFRFTGPTQGRHAIYYRTPSKTNDWLKLANIDIGTENLELGTIPQLLSTLSVNIQNDTNDPNLTVSQVFVQEGTKPWGQRAGLVVKPEEPNLPYTITNISTGKYTLVAARADDVAISQQIEITKEKHNITLNISGSSTLIGTISGKTPIAAVWRKDKKAFVIVRPDREGKFKIENLPAGEYSVGGNMMVDIGSLLSFNLDKGQTRSVDIDTSEYSKIPIAALTFRVLTEKGILIQGAEAWLESEEDIIEPVGTFAQGQLFLAEPGLYTLHATYPGFKEFIQPVLLEQRKPEESQATADKFIRLEKK